MRPLLAALCLFALLMPAIVLAQPATISGRVVHENSLQPIANARIVLGDFSLALRERASTVTNAEGDYSITTDIPYSGYSVMVWIDDARFPVTVYPDIKCNIGPASAVVTYVGWCTNLGFNIPLAAGAQVNGIDFTVNDAAQLSGVILGDSSPLTNASVAISGSSGVSVNTDAVGQFALTRMHAGSYSVYVNSPNHLFRTWPDQDSDNLGVVSGNAGQITLEPGQSMNLGSVNLVPSGSLRINLRRGADLANGQITVSSTTSGRQTVVSGAGGEALLDTIAAGEQLSAWVDGLGRYYPEAYADVVCSSPPCPGATLVTIASGAETQIEMQLEAKQRVTGVVIDASTGFGAADIEVFCAQRFNLPFSGAALLKGVSTTTDALGAFDLGGMDPGTCLIGIDSRENQVFLRALYPDTQCNTFSQCDAAGGSPISIGTLQTVSGIQLTATKGVRFDLQASVLGGQVNFLSYSVERNGELLFVRDRILQGAAPYQTEVFGAGTFAIAVEASLIPDYNPTLTTSICYRHPNAYLYQAGCPIPNPSVSSQYPANSLIPIQMSFDLPIWINGFE